ncbi:hypothetical protein QO002_004053 [Pararhizobium capsulatum DSM 1112]|uniref:Uncharacterized protein n=1 Tax=Pararhizobium capsulatum DSM 1112 TaxID=1121113 RepID=A0ABU0BUI9_9HYPH|nr:hypothetical protein [Pararhizobium capsulatum DSM 1112]
MARSLIPQRNAGCVNRTRGRRRTWEFFRFLPVANETADELLTLPARILFNPNLKAPGFEVPGLSIIFRVLLSLRRLFAACCATAC